MKERSNKRGRRFLLVFKRVFLIGGLVAFVLINAGYGNAGGPGSFARLAEQSSPSVVNISAMKVMKGPVMRPFRSPFGEGDPFEDFFERFFGDRMPKEFKQRSLGSGFVIDKDGLILTNNHVVEKTEDIEVTLSDGTELGARIVGRDPKTDLALIKIEGGPPLKSLPLGDSDALEVGDWVVAIGSPFGLGHTVTAGIVSAKYRHIGGAAYEDFIQTDASINPGNSGGPLLNDEGEVVGVNTAIFSRSGGNIGIGFAIPVNMVKQLLPQLKEGKVIRGWLGVMIQAITSELREKLDLKDKEGALVADVTAGGPADKAGIERGDVIVRFDGQEIEKMNELPFLVASTPIGKVVDVVVVRKGREKTLEVKIERMEEETAALAPAAGTGRKLGLGVQKITPELAREYNLGETDGLVVVQVAPNSPAAAAGLKPGDVILEMDQQAVTDVETLYEKIRKYEEGETILFLIKRSGSTLYVTVEL